MTTDRVPSEPLTTEPTEFVPAAEQREQLLATLAAAGVELGDHDRLIVEWLTTSPGWEWSTVENTVTGVRATIDDRPRRASPTAAVRPRTHPHG